MSAEADRIRDLEIRVANLLRIGKIASLDEANARVTVKLGDAVTQPLPWLTSRAGLDKTWWAPEVGESVLVLSPCGDTRAGVVLPAIYTEANAAPAAEKTKHRTVYSDGTFVEYDRAAHKLTATVQGTAEITTTGDAKVQSGGELRLKGATIILEGPVSATSTIDATGNISAPEAVINSLSFNNHRHTIPFVGVTNGPHA